MMLRTTATRTPITAPHRKALKTMPQGSLWDLSVFLNQTANTIGGMKANSSRIEMTEREI